MDRETFILQLGDLVFKEIVGNSSVQEMQVSHVRDLAAEAAPCKATGPVVRKNGRTSAVDRWNERTYVSIPVFDPASFHQTTSGVA